MSDSQATIQSIITKWEEMADRSAISRISEEIGTMFEEFAQAKVDPKDILRSKDKIVKIWVDLTWNEAKIRNPKWLEKSWWQKRKDKVIKVFGECYEELNSSKKPAKSEKSEEDYFSHMPSFTNIEDIQKWKARRSAN